MEDRRLLAAILITRVGMAVVLIIAVLDIQALTDRIAVVVRNALPTSPMVEDENPNRTFEAAAVGFERYAGT